MKLSVRGATNVSQTKEIETIETNFRQRLSVIGYRFQPLKQKEGSHTNLTQENFGGIRLSDTHFDRFCIPGSCWKGAMFVRVAISGGNLEKTNLSRSVLQQADLTKVRAISANFRASKWREVNAMDGNFVRTNLGNAVLKDVNLTRASLFSAYLQGTRFIRVDLTKADLQYANLENTIWEDANLANCYVFGAVFTNAKGLSQEQKIWLRQQGAFNVPA
ncbi:MAG: pentapeptide repeat-containing protein [Cyanobacteria bacterium SBLK]|nr:pentapeptide repeat-containing protein [Cyanobacteria bacterium SBLK]